ncbi:MAG: hypothetical protein PF569_03280 [Candidatus Woesearchaeota archaeon]|jgi:hypothetical protein|nr:hypothetical protein [Candidatus Woesearchaeota archaeon]
MAENKKSKNFYKFTTYVLLIVIVVAIAFYSFGVHSTTKFNEGVIYGQQLTSDYAVQTLNQNGYLPLTLGNQTIALVPSQMLQVAKEETILEILTYVQENGYVSLFINETEVVLVPYQTPQQ